MKPETEKNLHRTFTDARQNEPIRFVKSVQSESLWTLKDLMEHWKISESSARRIVRDGQIPVIRIGAQIRIDPADVNNFERKHKGRK